MRKIANDEKGLFFETDNSIKNTQLLLFTADGMQLDRAHKLENLKIDEVYKIAPKIETLKEDLTDTIPSLIVSNHEKITTESTNDVSSPMKIPFLPLKQGIDQIMPNKNDKERKKSLCDFSKAECQRRLIGIMPKLEHLNLTLGQIINNHSVNSKEYTQYENDDGENELIARKTDLETKGYNVGLAADVMGYITVKGGVSKKATNANSKEKEEKSVTKSKFMLVSHKKTTEFKNFIISNVTLDEPWQQKVLQLDAETDPSMRTQLAKDFIQELPLRIPRNFSIGGWVESVTICTSEEEFDCSKTHEQATKACIMKLDSTVGSINPIYGGAKITGGKEKATSNSNQNQSEETFHTNQITMNTNLTIKGTLSDTDHEKWIVFETEDHQKKDFLMYLPYTIVDVIKLTNPSSPSFQNVAKIVEDHLEKLFEKTDGIKKKINDILKNALAATAKRYSKGMIVEQVYKEFLG